MEIITKKIQQYQQDPRLNKRNFVLVGAFVMLALMMLGGIVIGAVNIPLSEVGAVLIRAEQTEHYRILYHIRIPRVIVGALTGLNLAVAGCILQGVLRNPLADPGIIGISAGAGLAAMFVMILFPEQTMLVPIVAFAGAMLATAIVFLLAWERGIQPIRMILAGVAVGAFFGGGMSALMVFHADKVQGTVSWMAGGFQGRSWSHVLMILPYSVIGLVGTFLGYRHLNALQLGDDVAKSIGTHVERTRFFMVILAALLAASAVSVAGMLGFVGLIVPHMMRMIIGSDFEFLLPCSALFGAALVVGADTVARTMFSPIEVPVGVFMAFLGAPFFLYLLKKGLSRQ
ncbi:MAG: ABC-type transporter, integral rane subunit [Firmicutes bacterium]|nr:ABC-type transporter, integral rane subunit [Bacillota bacterium]